LTVNFSTIIVERAGERGTGILPVSLFNLDA